MDKTLDNLREMGIRLNKAVSGYWWVVWTILTPIASLVSNTLLLLLLSIPGASLAYCNCSAAVSIRAACQTHNRPLDYGRPGCLAYPWSTDSIRSVIN